MVKFPNMVLAAVVVYLSYSTASLTNADSSKGKKKGSDFDIWWGGIKVENEESKKDATRLIRGTKKKKVLNPEQNHRSLLESSSYSCPSIGNSTLVPSGSKIRLEIANYGKLCTLTEFRELLETSIPVGRSYNGHGWERVAGPYSTLQYNCEGSYCEVTIPKDLSKSDQSFELKTVASNAWENIAEPYSLLQLSKRDEAARFLEQTTFGTTRENLDEMTQNIDENTNLLPKFKAWIDNQINEVDASSHRAFYRRHASSRMINPSSKGRQSRPCEVGARFRWYSFSWSDRGEQLIVEKKNGIYALFMHGEIRTMVEKLEFDSGKIFDHEKGESFRICKVEERVYGQFAIKYGGSCEKIKVGNPAIRLDGMNPQPTHILNIDISNTSNYVFDAYEGDEKKIETMLLKKSIHDDVHVCGSIPYPIGKAVYAKVNNGQFMIFEPGIKFEENTMSQHKWDGGGKSVIDTNGVTQCANVERTFLNEHSCELSDSDTACAPYGKVEGTVALSPDFLRKVYELKRVPLYAIVGLRVEDDETIMSPCTPGERSRWTKVETCTENVEPDTSILLGTLLRHGRKENINLKDIYLRGSDTCHWQDRDLRQLYVKVDGQCYKNVHPDMNSVYDFTQWIALHPGGPVPIRQPGKEGSHEINFPSDHSMMRWVENKDKLQYIGRLGDELEFADIPIGAVQNVNVAEAFGVYVPKPEGRNILVCGSPHEVANHELSIPRFFVSQGGNGEALNPEEYEQQRRTVWTMTALHSRDQLRQRVAWALSQLLAISPSALPRTNTESFLVYYDIFVRNAFGSYRDILTEVSYSPMMSEMLTYYESKSSEYMWKIEGTMQYADENYARELMQLFTVGLVKLNQDGTPMLEKESPIPTYDNDDITEYARVWTGFTRQGPRGNVEERDNTGNSIDPMKIRVEWRDQFPKLGLDGKYVGDTYPLCDDFPSNYFLRKGAKWKLLGKTKLPEDQNLLLSDKTAADGSKNNVHVTTLNSWSDLAKTLCKAVNGKCTYPSIVEIGDNLPCTGEECSLDRMKVAEVGEGIYYEFIRPPCVNFPFFDKGKRVFKSKSNIGEGSTCVSQRSAVAAPACCDTSSEAICGECAFTGERVNYSEARSRCLQRGFDICHQYNSVLFTDCGICSNYAGYFWSSVDCNVYAIVDEQGKVAIERQADDSELDYRSLTFFRVHWGNDEKYPKTGNVCGNGSCEPAGSYCRCEVHVDEAQVFQFMPSRNEILSRLHIGGVDPWMKDYESTERFGDVILHIVDGKNPFDKQSMFEVVDDFGRKLYLMNTESAVKVGAFHFRNTPSFYNGIPELLDAQYETDAALDHYFYHTNTAPFLALRFIQRFGISNPSPGFVERVANAFKHGRVDTMLSIGSGKYGDLGATITSIILDKESRSVILDSDPSHGSLREPLIKVIAMMRNLNYQQGDGQFTSLYDLQTLIGEGMHDMPSVFSFFLPEYSPPGKIAASSLVSPEAMLLPHAIGTINGMISMIKFGLNSCYGGFGGGFCNRKELEDTSNLNTIGRPASTIDVKAESVDELATILTSGRMSLSNRQVIKGLYSKIDSDEEALSLAQQLAVTSPEFHSTGLSKNEGFARPPVEANKKTCNRHKSIIHVLLKGGCDSFNLLVPHSGCSGNDLNKQYMDERGSVAIANRDLLEIDASSSLQQCKKFGLHPKLPTLQDLYNEGDALFVAGVGVLTEPVSKSNYVAKTKTQLFAHNTLQAEIGRLDPLGSFVGTGTLGRLSDVLNSNSYSVNSISIDASLIPLQGGQLNANKVSVGSKTGFQVLNPSAPTSQVSTMISVLNGNVEDSSGIYSDIWSSSLHEATQRNSQFYWAGKSVPLAKTSFPKTELGNQLRLVAKMVGSNECRGADRDIFYVETGRYDHHTSVLTALDREFTILDGALDAFVTEMKAQEKWDDVTIVVSSDFGRTLNPNSGKGTDHGWSGSSFILGGQVKGGQILGEYPSDLSNGGPLNIGRGRLIPTIPFEAIWNGVSKWLGVHTDEDLDKVLPNRNSFPGRLFDEIDLYEDRTDTKGDCEGVGTIVSCIPNDALLSVDDDMNLDQDGKNVYSDDMILDQEDEEGREKTMNDNVAVDNTKLVRNATLVAVACALFAFILVGIVIMHKKRNNRMSFSFTQRYRSVKERLDAVIVPKVNNQGGSELELLEDD